MELLGFPRELLGFTRNYRDFVPSFLCLDQLALELDGSSVVFCRFSGLQFSSTLHLDSVEDH